MRRPSRRASRLALHDALVNVNGFRFAKEVQGLGAEVLVTLYEDSVAAEDRSAAYVKIIERKPKRCP